MAARLLGWSPHCTQSPTDLCGSSLSLISSCWVTPVKGNDHALLHVNRSCTYQSGCHFFSRRHCGFLEFGLDVPHAVVQLLMSDSLRPHGPGFPDLHYLPEFAQTHVCWVGGAIQPFLPLLPPSPALSLSQHQGPHTFAHMPCTILPEQSTWIRIAVDLPPFPARPCFLLQVRISSCSLLYSGFLPHCEVLVRSKCNQLFIHQLCTQCLCGLGAPIGAWNINEHTHIFVKIISTKIYKLLSMVPDI